MQGCCGGCTGRHLEVTGCKLQSASDAARHPRGVRAGALGIREPKLRCGRFDAGCFVQKVGASHAGIHQMNVGLEGEAGVSMA